MNRNSLSHQLVKHFLSVIAISLSAGCQTPAALQAVFPVHQNEGSPESVVQQASYSKSFVEGTPTFESARGSWNETPPNGWGDVLSNFMYRNRFSPIYASHQPVDIKAEDGSVLRNEVHMVERQAPELGDIVTAWNYDNQEEIAANLDEETIRRNVVPVDLKTIPFLEPRYSITGTNYILDEIPMSNRGFSDYKIRHVEGCVTVRTLPIEDFKRDVLPIIEKEHTDSTIRDHYYVCDVLEAEGLIYEIYEYKKKVKLDPKGDSHWIKNEFGPNWGVNEKGLLVLSEPMTIGYRTRKIIEDEQPFNPKSVETAEHTVEQKNSSETEANEFKTERLSYSEKKLKDFLEIDRKHKVKHDEPVGQFTQFMQDFGFTRFTSTPVDPGSLYTQDGTNLDSLIVHSMEVLEDQDRNELYYDQEIEVPVKLRFFGKHCPLSEAGPLNMNEEDIQKLKDRGLTGYQMTWMRGQPYILSLSHDEFRNVIMPRLKQLHGSQLRLPEFAGKIEDQRYVAEVLFAEDLEYLFYEGNKYQVELDLDVDMYWVKKTLGEFWTISDEGRAILPGLHVIGFRLRNVNGDDS